MSDNVEPLERKEFPPFWGLRAQCAQFEILFFEFSFRAVAYIFKLSTSNILDLVSFVIFQTPLGYVSCILFIFKGLAIFVNKLWFIKKKSEN